MSLPETCPFCGSGSDMRNGEKWIGFTCITTIRAGHDARRLQSVTCAGLERTRLLARVAELEALCKLLELAGDNLDLSIACGCGVDGPCQMCRRASDSWRQAKEAKP